LRQSTYTAYRASLGRDGEYLPEDFSTVVAAVTAFADYVVDSAPNTTVWHASSRTWTA